MTKLNSTTYSEVAANTVFDAVLDAPKLLAWRLDVKTVVNDNDDVVIAHVAEKATASVLGHVKVDNATITADANGVITSQGKFKVGNFTRDLSLTGTQAITGIGFIPKLVMLYAVVAGVAGKMSIGFYDGTAIESISDNYNSVANSFWTYVTSAVSILNSAGNATNATGFTLDADGFTLTWTKVGTGATGTAGIHYIAFR